MYGESSLSQKDVEHTNKAVERTVALGTRMAISCHASKQITATSQKKGHGYRNTLLRTVQLRLLVTSQSFLIERIAFAIKKAQ